LYDISPGVHTLSFYAVDNPEGRVSEGISYSVDVMPEATISDSFEETSLVRASAEMIVSDGSVWSDVFESSDGAFDSQSIEASYLVPASTPMKVSHASEETLMPVITSQFDESTKCPVSEIADSHDFSLSTGFLISGLPSSGVVIEKTDGYQSSDLIEASRDSALTLLLVSSLIDPSLNFISDRFDVGSSAIESVPLYNSEKSHVSVVPELSLNLPSAQLVESYASLALTSLSSSAGITAATCGFGSSGLIDVTECDGYFSGLLISSLNGPSLELFATAFEEMSSLRQSERLRVSEAFPGSDRLQLSDSWFDSHGIETSFMLPISRSMACSEDKRHTSMRVITSRFSGSEKCSISNTADSPDFDLTATFVTGLLFSGVFIERTAACLSSELIEASRSDRDLSVLVDSVLNSISGRVLGTLSVIPSDPLQISDGLHGSGVIGLSGRHVSDAFVDVNLSALPASNLVSGSLAFLSTSFDVTFGVIDSRWSHSSGAISVSDPRISKIFVVSELLLSEILVEETNNYLLSKWIDWSGIDVDVSVLPVSDLVGDSLTLLSGCFDATADVFDSRWLDTSDGLSRFSHVAVDSQGIPASDIFPASNSMIFTNDIRQAPPTRHLNADSSVSSSHEEMTINDSDSSLSWTANSTSIFSPTVNLAANILFPVGSMHAISPILRSLRLDISSQLSGFSHFGVCSQQVLTSDIFVVSSSVNCTRELERALPFTLSRTHRLDSGSSVSSCTREMIVNDSNSSLSWDGSTSVFSSTAWYRSSCFVRFSPVINGTCSLSVSSGFSGFSDVAVPSRAIQASDVFPVSNVICSDDLKEALPSTPSLTRHPDADSSISSSHNEMTVNDSDLSFSWTNVSTSMFRPSGFSNHSLFLSFGETRCSVTGYVSSPSVDLTSSCAPTGVSLLDPSFEPISASFNTMSSMLKSFGLSISSQLSGFSHPRAPSQQTRASDVLLVSNSVTCTDDSQQTHARVKTYPFVPSASLGHDSSLSSSRTMDETIQYRSSPSLETTVCMESINTLFVVTLLNPSVDFSMSMADSSWRLLFAVTLLNPSFEIFSPYFDYSLSMTDSYRRLWMSTGLFSSIGANAAHVGNVSSAALIGGLVGGLIALGVIGFMASKFVLRREEEEEEEEEAREIGHELQFENAFPGLRARDASGMIYGNKSSFSLAVQSFAIPGNPQAILDFNPEEYFV
jgi:hypothetical protein